MTGRNPWTIAILTGTGVFTTFLLRFNVSGIGLVLIQPQSDFHLTKLQLGLVFSAFLIPYTILQPFAGWATDRFGAKATLFIGTLAASMITIFTGFFAAFLALLSLRAILGIAQAPNFVSGAKVSSSNWFSPSQRARSTSAWIAGGRLGTAVALPLGATLAVVYSWRWAFYLTGAIGLLWCAGWLLSFQEQPGAIDQHDSGNDKIRSRVRLALPIIASPLVLGLALASFGQGYLAYLLGNWLPTYLATQGFTIVNAGLLSFLPIIAAVLTIILVGGFVSDRLVDSGAHPVGLRSRLFSIGMLGASFMMVLTAYSGPIAARLGVPGGYLALLSLTIAGGMWGIATPSLWAALIDAVPKEVVGAVSGVQNLGGNAGGIAVSLLTGYFVGATNTFFLAILLTSGITLIGALSALFLVKPRTSKSEKTVSRLFTGT